MYSRARTRSHSGLPPPSDINSQGACPPCLRLGSALLCTPGRRPCQPCVSRGLQAQCVGTKTGQGRTLQGESLGETTFQPHLHGKATFDDSPMFPDQPPLPLIRRRPSMGTSYPHASSLSNRQRTSSAHLGQFPSAEPTQFPNSLQGPISRPALPPLNSIPPSILRAKSYPLSARGRSLSQAQLPPLHAALPPGHLSVFDPLALQMRGPRGSDFPTLLPLLPRRRTTSISLAEAGGPSRPSMFGTLPPLSHLPSTGQLPPLPPHGFSRNRRPSLVQASRSYNDDFGSLSTAPNGTGRSAEELFGSYAPSSYKALLALPSPPKHPPRK
ncbi:hypothetical protein P389DRAFT_46327 [Cystobasidium minutum MCA 4210]|uniref:uncharacterized protein n=1 Tax=Cystobasidium minutum MCA 4210 TaxID=1397322 RepID=UPI0034CF6765|eukprot:jgi/Rhomi1/46327/CE46326_121